MKKVVLFLLVCLCVGCKKKKSNTTAISVTQVSYTYNQVVDSLGVQFGKACYVGFGTVPADTIFFNSDQTITEKVQGRSISYNVGYYCTYFKNSVEKILDIRFYIASDTIPDIHSSAYQNYKFLNYLGDSILFQSISRTTAGIIPLMSGEITDTSAARAFDLYYTP